MLARAFVSLALASVAYSQGAVLVVDAAGGPGAFPDLQPAIDAAADGDVVLVRSGAYGAFTLAGKGVSVVADTDAEVMVDGPLRVLDVPAGSVAVLRGLATASPAEHGVRVADCAGAVRIEECALVAATSYLNTGAWIEDSASVLIARSTLFGGKGVYDSIEMPLDGGAAVRAWNSSVVLSGCTLHGGDGADSHEDEWYTGGDGGAGVDLFGSDAWISGCIAYGGKGGYGLSDYDKLLGVLKCGNGGNGGHGVAVRAALIGSRYQYCTVTVRDLTAFPGIGGASLCASPGLPGMAMKVENPPLHDVTLLNGPARDAWASSPVRSGANARFYAQGAPGDVAFAAIGFASPLLAVPAQALPLAVLPPAAVVVLGTIPPSGVLQHTVAVPPLPSGFEGATLAVQGAALTAGAPGFEIAPFGTITWLDPAF